MLEIFDAILSVRTDTTYLVAGLTIACSLIFLQLTESRILTLLFTPLAAMGALIGIYLSRELGLYYSTNKDANIIMSGLFGLFLSLLIVVIIARLSFLFFNFLRRKQAKRLRHNRKGEQRGENAAAHPLNF